MRNIKITLEYDGTNYYGWQYQKNTDQTIQQKLEDCLSKVNKKEVKVTSAGRTDSGVHARNQVANFYLDVPVPVNSIPEAINRLLPRDILCKKAELVADDFHAQHDAEGKKYCYRFVNKNYPSVFVRNYVYSIRQPLDFGQIRAALPHFRGSYDFRAFMASGSDMKNTVRTIKKININRDGDEYRVEIVGDGFLYKMVRIIMGTIFEIGLGKKAAGEVPDIIKSKDRQKAGFTAPAKGLTLLKVYYP